MKEYMPFTPDEIYLANNADLLKILSEKGVQFEKSGHEYLVLPDKNISIRGHFWYDQKAQDGGYPIEFMKKYYNMNFHDSMRMLLSNRQEMHERQGQRSATGEQINNLQPKSVESTSQTSGFSKGDALQQKENVQIQHHSPQHQVSHQEQRKDERNQQPKQFQREGNGDFSPRNTQQSVVSPPQYSNQGHFQRNQGEIQEKPPFQLPNRNDKMSRTFAYLTKGRKLDYDVISHFAKARTLYESCEVFDPQKKPIHNAVFVGTDENGVPRHAHKHGLSSYGDSFKQNIVSSESAYSFHHVGRNDRLYIFEAPIDMMSFISLYKQDWQESSYVALCGVGSLPIQWMTSQFPQLQKVCLCLDNDSAGIEATNAIIKEFDTKGFETHFLLPQAKDWNEDLVNLREQAQNQNFSQGAVSQGGYAMGMQ